MPERQAKPLRRLRIGAMTMSGHSASGPPDLAWTGERYLPGIGGPIGLEHLHRYLLAAELANDKVVVDIACGEGYGSALLAVSAARVYGVDIAAEAVDFARHKYARSTLEFLLGSCTAIPLPDASADLVVSFETLEHHAQHDEMMQEVRRILRPDGVLIISSPDRREYTEVLGNANTYHLKELYREEFEGLLQRHFSHTRLFGQRMVFGSNIALVDTAPAPCDYVTFSGDTAASARTAGIERPVYFVAMASDQALPALPNSFFQGAYGDLQAKEERLAHLGIALKEKDERLATLGRSVADHVDRIAALQHGVGERDARIARLEHAVFEGEEKSMRLAQELATQEAKLAGVLASNSWLMTSPLRWLRRSLLTRPLWLARQALADPMRRAWLGLPHAADRGRQLIAAVHGRFALAIGGRRDRPAPQVAATGVAHARQCMPDAQTSSATPLPAAESATAARRVVVVAHDAHPHGAQYLALGIARELSRSFACEVEVVCLGGGQLKAGFAEYATLHDLENIDPRGPQACELAADLYRRGFRHAIVNTTVAGHFLATLKLAGLHCVALIHEMRGVILAHHLQSQALCIANHADRVVFSAPAVRHDFNTFAPIDQHRTILRPQGLYKRNPWAAGGARDARQALRGELELPPAAKIVLGVGYADHRKGVDYFIDIANRARAVDPLIHFVWVGHWAVEMQRIVADLEAGQPGNLANIHFIGRRDDTSIYYAGADVFALTSREDPFPAVILESMEVGLPVVAFSGSGGGNALIDEGIGINVPMGDTQAFAAVILHLLTENSVRAGMGRRGRDLAAERFSFRHYLFDLLEYAGLGMHKVSVIVPNFNYGRYLGARLSSILGQSYPPYEIIFLDDASSDDSEAIALAALEAGEIDYRIIGNQSNSGSVFAQWKRGAEASRGDIVWIAEADDFSAPMFLETVIRGFVEPGVVLSYCESKQIDSNGQALADNYHEYVADLGHERWLDPYMNDGSDEIRRFLAVKNTIPNVSGVLMMRSVLVRVLSEQFEDISRYRVAGDWKTYLHLLSCGRLAYFPQALNQHRRHYDGVTLGSVGLAQLGEIREIQQWVATKYACEPATLLIAGNYLQKLCRQFNVPVDEVLKPIEASGKD